MQLTEQHAISHDDPRYQAIDAAAFVSTTAIHNPVTREDERAAMLLATKIKFEVSPDALREKAAQ
jgi:hypothetical protein